MPEKEKIYLTFIGLHTRGIRPTLNYAKVEDRGRMYVPFQKGKLGVPNPDSEGVPLVIELPPDLKERLARDEVEIMIPADGLYIYAGKDIEEYLAKEDAKKRRMGQHSARVSKKRHK